MKKYILLVSVGIKHWCLTTMENYTARISNARDIWEFDWFNGFDSTEDVLSYIETHFKIDRSNIEIQ